jgi:hypothetical protein
MNHAEREDIIDIVTDICIKNQSHGIGPASNNGRQIQQERKQEGQTDPSKHHERKSFYQFCQCLPPERGNRISVSENNEITPGDSQLAGVSVGCGKIPLAGPCLVTSKSKFSVVRLNQDVTDETELQVSSGFSRTFRNCPGRNSEKKRHRGSKIG